MTGSSPLGYTWSLALFIIPIVVILAWLHLNHDEKYIQKSFWIALAVLAFMPNYRRYRVKGGTYFFTVNLLQRYPNDLLVRHIECLRTAIRHVRKKWPFHIDAWVVLPDHLHCVWTLPMGDDDFTNRWRLIKQDFSKALPLTESRSSVRIARGERAIWQRRFWEHAIRNDEDYAAHVDYCHINPLKHGYVKQLADWPYSTFHRYVERGIYPADWAGSSTDADIHAGEF